MMFALIDLVFYLVSLKMFKGFAFW